MAEYSAGRPEPGFQDLEDRVHRLDNDVTGMGRDIKTLFTSLDNLTKVVERGFGELRAQSKVPMSNWIGLFAVLFTVFGGMCAMFFLVLQMRVTPIEVTQQYYSQRVQDVRQQVEQLEQSRRDHVRRLESFWWDEMSDSMKRDRPISSTERRTPRPR